MSEITTGAVSLSSIGSPMTFGSVCKSAENLIEKITTIPYQQLLKEIEKTNDKLRWLDVNMKSSPKQMMVEAIELQRKVAGNNAFIQFTEGMNENSKRIISGIIATQNSPMNNQTFRLLEEMPQSGLIFQEVLEASVHQLALDNFNYVRKIIEDSANATGFNIDKKILKQKNDLVDLVFIDEKNRRLTAYCKLDKEMNPSLALDLEGFSCNEKECSEKMSQIVSYLQDNGVPFHYQRLKHNQPQGILRELLKKQNLISEKKSVETYFQKAQNFIKNPLKKF